MAAPVKYTCPDIDSVIEDLKNVIKHLSSCDQSTALIGISDVIPDLEKYTARSWNPLEELREANGKLREWGEDMESEVKAKEEEIDILTEEVHSLKYQLQKSEEAQLALREYILNKENEGN